MKISVLTLFPEFINHIRDFSIVGRAIGEGKLDLETVDIRDFAINKYLQVDDYPYGGGPGMLMQIKPNKTNKNILKKLKGVLWEAPDDRIGMEDER